MITDLYISDLLFVHNCVIIPGFGGFIGNYSPSRINHTQHAFYPPFKSILFNVNLKQNDGLLANAIASSENISYEEALRQISLLISQWEKELEGGNRITIGKVGIIFKDSEGNLQFEQDTEINFLASSFGLTPVISPAIRRVRIHQKIEKKVTNYLEETGNRRFVLPKPLKWAAILALPVGISALIGIQHFDTIRDFSSAYSGWYTSKWSPFANPVSVPVVTKGGVARPVVQLSAVKFKTAPIIPVEPASPKPAVKSPETQVHSVFSPSKEMPYAIIVGAFRCRENAVNLVERLLRSGYPAAIEDTTKTGLVRVRIAGFSEKNEAVQQLAAIRSKDFSGAWLLRK